MAFSQFFSPETYGEGISRPTSSYIFETLTQTWENKQDQKKIFHLKVHHRESLFNRIFKQVIRRVIRTQRCFSLSLRPAERREERQRRSVTASLGWQALMQHIQWKEQEGHLTSSSHPIMLEWTRWTPSSYTCTHTQYPRKAPFK